jgi:hypothetical protein
MIKQLTKGPRFAAAAVAVVASVWVATGSASSADRSTPTEPASPPSRMEPLPSPISSQDAQRPRAQGEAVTSSAQPSAEDVAGALRISVEEAKELLDRSQRHTAGLSAMRPGPGESRGIDR